MTREEENQLLEFAARWEAVCDVLDGEEVEEFMMSFPEVRRVADLVALHQKVCNVWTADPQEHT